MPRAVRCAPFHQPYLTGPRPPLVSPNGDAGVDACYQLATICGTCDNRSANVLIRPPTPPLEAVSACTGMFGTGSYPGYAGKLLVDPVTGASYNAKGVSGRKYLLPAMWDPKTSQSPQARHVVTDFVASLSLPPRRAVARTEALGLLPGGGPMDEVLLGVEEPNAEASPSAARSSTSPTRWGKSLPTGAHHRQAQPKGARRPRINRVLTSETWASRDSA
ncbi:uncharacterized protein A4U43_C03F2830 [Asparagus officinalis]|uniref:Uncharacterized protein n=1 Tax=Asparagus officinalis TaxID=4686 RepID=A0A5P1F6V0_ASPOF|nr:uncharacterized protein A4U43_C03F2830 [Asparagus officinalis]